MSNITIVSENMRGVKDFQLDYEGEKKSLHKIRNYFVKYYRSQVIGQKNKFVLEAATLICI